MEWLKLVLFCFLFCVVALVSKKYRDNNKKQIQFARGLLLCYGKRKSAKRRWQKKCCTNSTLKKGNKYIMKSALIKIWEGIGIISILLLLFLPNGKTMMNSILETQNVKGSMYIGMSIADFTAMGLFLLVYVSSLIFFRKESMTKLFSVLATALMIITLISRMMF